MVNTARQQAKHALPVIRKQFDREVESILDHKMEGMSKKNRRIHYLVKWKGFSNLMQVGRKMSHCGSLKVDRGLFEDPTDEDIDFF